MLYGDTSILNFSALKTKFQEYLIDQGLISRRETQGKDFDNLSIFSFGSEFKKFVDTEYAVNLENEYAELAELFEADTQDGQFILDEDKTSDEQTNFMLDLVNSLAEDEEFVENLEQYAANDNQEDSMLDLLNDLFKDKGISDDSLNKDINGIDDSGSISGNNNGTQNTGANPPSIPKSPAGNNIFTPPMDGTKDYSNMNKNELEKALDSQKNKINENSKTFDDTITKNQDDIAKAKEEYDAAMEEDNVDPALLESRNQNLEAITQTDNAINELNSNISDLDSQISSVDSDISGVESSISALNSAMASLSAPADDKEAQAAIESKRAAISAQIAQLNSQKQTLTAEKTNLESQKTEKETSLNENTTLLQRLETEKSNIENQILQTCNENTRNALENYNQVRNNAATAIQSAKENLKNEQKELGEIEKHLNTAKAKELEDEYSYKPKANAFKDNNGYELVKGEGETNMDYSVIQPKDIDPTKEAPVMLYLHGGGGSERSLYNQVMDDYNLQEGFNGYIICPTANRSDWTKDGVAEDIDEILNTFAQTHKIDPNNIVVVGHSMGGTGALHLADSDVFKDDEGFKFSKVAAITGYSTEQKDYDIPVALYADSTSEYALKNHLLNADENDKYFDWVGEQHTNMDNRAFTEDADGDGKADLLEWLFDQE